MKIKRLTVEIDKELHNNAKLKAYSKGMTLKEVIINLLKKWLKK